VGMRGCVIDGWGIAQVAVVTHSKKKLRWGKEHEKNKKYKVCMRVQCKLLLDGFGCGPISNKVNPKRDFK